MSIEPRTLGATAVIVVATLVMGLRAASARESGIQRTPDGARVLVSKDVAGQRYAITLNTGDDSVTGNVFFTDGGPPKFIACTSAGPSRFSCRVADACTDGGRESGIQSVPGGGGVLVSKDVEGQRYAITANTDGTLTGNVFFSATGGATFIFCQPAEGGAYSCSLADSCTQMPCAGQYTPLGTTITLPASFFSVPGECPAYGDAAEITLPKNFFVPDPEMMAESSRQVLDNNPFRNSTITKVKPNDQRSADAVVARGAAAGVAPVSVPGDRALCPVSGFQELEACDLVPISSGFASVSTIGFQACTSRISAAGGLLVQDGTLRILIPDATSCILSTRQELPIGVELGEERENFVIRFFDASGALALTEIESLQQVITQLNVCTGVDERFASNRRRNLNGTVEDIVPVDGEDTHLLRTYTDVAFTREYSSDCGTRMTTFEEGQIATEDEFLDERYATRFDGLQYALSGANDATFLSIDGSLAEACSGSDRTFSYRTLTPASFDRDGDGCPRGGAFELSFEGAVFGQMSFTDTGGLTLTPASGAPPMVFADCFDPALRLQSCGD